MDDHPKYKIKPFAVGLIIVIIVGFIAFLNLSSGRKVSTSRIEATVSIKPSDNQMPNLENIQATVAVQLTEANKSLSDENSGTQNIIQNIKPTTKPNLITQAPETTSASTTVTYDMFPNKLEDYLNNAWDEMPGTSYKAYWWETWDGTTCDPSILTHLVVEPDFEPTTKQCQRIAQAAAIDRVNLLDIKEGVIHVVKQDNSGDYCTLRTP